jgi:hypothetical protein
MKHILLLTFVFSIVSFQIAAQGSLKLSPETVEVDVDKTQFETVAHTMVTNIGDSSVTIRWVRQVESISMGWESAICDINACYATVVDSTPADFYLTLAPGDSSILDVHIRPGGVDGSARIKVLIEEVGNKENQVIGTYLFNETLSSIADIQADNIRLYPNPVVEYFQLSHYEHVSKVMLYNIAGGLMQEYISYPGEKFDVTGQQKGMYLVRLLDRNKHVIKTLVLHKR